MAGPGILRRAEGNLVTRAGAWFPGERVVFRGKDLHADLGGIEWLDLYIYGVSGRRLPKVQLRLINAMWVFTSFPDPRLWNNRVAALSGTARSTANLALSAAVAVSEASVYGRRADIQAFNLIQRLNRSVSAGETLGDLIVRELNAKRRLPGYGRPVTREDERIKHILTFAREAGMEFGPHVRLAQKVGAYLKDHRWRMGLNYGGVTAALCADLGFDARLYYLTSLFAFVAGMLPCYVEASETDEGSFFPLRCSTVAYEGRSRRPWRV